MERALNAWPLCSAAAAVPAAALGPPPAPPPPPATETAPPAEEEEMIGEGASKLRGPSCSGTFLISMLSFRSMRGGGAEEHSRDAAGESGEGEGVCCGSDAAVAAAAAGVR